MVKLKLPQIQDLMKRYLEQDRENQTLEIEAFSIDEALKNASIELEVPISKLEFEIIHEGNSGFLGIGKKNYKLKVSAQVERTATHEIIEKDDDFENAFNAKSKKEADVDGDVFVRLAIDGALLKVTSPKGKGKFATEKMAIDRLHSRAVRNFNEALVSKVVKQASGDYVVVGEFITNPSNDALMSVDIQNLEMECYIVLMPPGPGGCDLSKDAIITLLRNNRVIFGIDEEAIQNLEDRPRFKEPVLVASGQKPINGKDAYIQYNFETDQSKVRLKESTSGKVNFKELNLIQNVVAGQPLARKVPAEKGINGKSVTGKLLQSKNGKDIPLPLGKNVHMSNDELTVVSDINGQVMISGTKINVEEILTIQGDVCLKTGNILFLGTVVIHGNVEDGYQIKASGNIEVIGSVGKSLLDAEGDVIVHQGIAGKNAGEIRAGRSVWAKFIENAKVDVEEYVVVSDGIINSEVNSNKKIVCQGKRASIVGGRLRAAVEINAKALGSPVGGSETILEAGIDPKSKQKLDSLIKQQDVLINQIDELDKNIVTLTNFKKVRKQLPPEKEALLQEYTERKNEYMRNQESIIHEIETIQTYLNQIKAQGKISASGKVYPGVKILIRDIPYEVKNDLKGVTFYLENGLIRTAKYEEIDDEDIKKGRPDAYKTN